MVKIRKGSTTAEVSRTAFEKIFKKQGFELVSDAVETKPVVVEDGDKKVEDNDEGTDDDFVEAFLEKPLSECTGKEMKRFAKIKGIDMAGVKNNDDARERVQAFLEKEDEEDEEK